MVFNRFTLLLVFATCFMASWEESCESNERSNIPSPLNSTREARQAKKEDDPSCLKRWPGAKVPFRFDYTDKPIISDYVETIKTGIRKYEADTCLMFEDITDDSSKWNQEHLVFQSASIGCHATIGRWCNKHGQHVNLDHGCGTLGLVMHEIGHALGVYHQHVRPDRDQHVRILKENIYESLLTNFEIKEDSEIFDVPYDYSSLLHYGKYTSSKNGKPTIETLDPMKQFLIGNPPEPSHYDLMLLNRMYDCAAGCSDVPTCENGGYIDKTCKCRCPHNTEGDTCETVTGDYYPKTATDCGEQVIESDAVIQSPNYPSAKPSDPSVLKCMWYLKAPKGKLAKITFDNFDLYDYSGCKVDSVDVLSDMYTIYKRECGSRLHGMHMTAETETKSMFVYYTGRSPGWRKGFQASVTFIDDDTLIPPIPKPEPPVIPPKEPCYIALELEKFDTDIKSEDYPKGKGKQRCEWLITNMRNTDLKQCVKIEITQFDMGNNKGCKNSYIKVDPKGKQNFWGRKKICSKRTIKAGKKMSVLFKTTKEGSYKGFKAVVSKTRC